MFNLFGFLKKNKKKEETEKYIKVGTGIAFNNSNNSERLNLKKIFSKPKKYAGNREIFDSGNAKKNVKLEAFSSGKKVMDEYTGKELKLTIQEAKIKYGEKWADHVAEGDHIHPLKKVVEENKNNPWLTNEDIKEIANSKENMQNISRTFNNAKRDRTNKEFVNDKEYLKNKGIKLSEENKIKAIETGEKAHKFIKQEMRKRTVKNTILYGHNAGMNIAKHSAGTSATISTILNIVDVINCKKTAKEAAKDVSIITTKAAVTGYVFGGGGGVISHSLSYSKSDFIRALSNSNVPSKVITAVMTTGDIAKKYVNGEISTQECILELGERGLNVATAGYSMAVGQALIPIPIVGGAVGALVGSVLTSKYYNSLISDLKNKELAHKERLKIMAECKEAEREVRAFRKELQVYLDNYFYDYKSCFDEALSEIEISFKTENANGVISGANKITRKLGGKIYYNNVKEFKTFLDSDEVDIF